MALQPGSTLGPYQILSLIGAGGMGEVYRARDPRLNRDVAIKVLPADRVSDEDRRRRFVQEAHAASALNHPHIITIHEIEEANGHDFIVMEYVRGKSLDALIPRHGMRLGEMLRVAIPVADALAAAHARGIIHRDLKPANVMVGTDGAVKVLDFGLAKLSGSDDAADDHLTHTAAGGLSAPGTIAGTAAYMSPEQATGGPVDARSDIFSFGALLYEMVTGARAFAGTSTADTLSAVIRAQPKAPSAIVANVASDLEKVILQCLRKDPPRRYQHIDDVKVALEDVKEASESGVTARAPVVRSRRRPIAALVATALVTMGATAWLLLPSHRRTPAPAPMRTLPLTSLTGSELYPTFSPDGEQVAFSWNGTKQDNWDIYVTLVGSSDVRRLTSDLAEDARPTWSPDGRQIAFVRQRGDDSTIHLISPLGGAERRVGDFRSAASLDWSPDGKWLVAGNSGQLNFGLFLLGRPGGQGPRGIYLVSVDSGAVRPLIVSNSNRVDAKPAFSPDGRHLGYVSCDSSGVGMAGMRDCKVALVEVDLSRGTAQPPRRLTSTQTLYIDSLAWTRDGSAIIYAAVTTVPVFSLSSLWRVTIDGNRAPERIDAGELATAPALARSRDRLAFTHMSRDSDIYRSQAGGPVQLVAGSSFMDEDARLSPDGRRLAFSSGRSGTAADIWIAEADGSNPQQLTHGPGDIQGSPSWSRDGRRIAFDADGEDSRRHLWMIDTDGGAQRRLTAEKGDQVGPTWSQDGRWIYYSWWQADGRDIWRMPADGGVPQRLTHGAAGAFACESADGKSLLFQPKDADSPLMTMALAGGQTRQLIACVRNSAFGVNPRGVYYVPCDLTPDPPLYVLDPKTGRTARLGRLDGLTTRPLGLSVSPDGNTVIYPRQVLSRADLMLIENFR